MISNFEFQQINFENIKILLVEDNPGDARLIEEFLSEIGKVPSQLAHVECLDDAISLLDNEEFQLILLDLNLPDSRGIETFTTIKNQGVEIPIVALSGLDDETIALEAVHQGAQDYLVKGEINPHLLWRSIQYAIERQKILKDHKQILEVLHESEKELKKHRDHLEELVLLRTKELKNTQAQLVQSAKLASAGEMATGIAHELNQPLNIIQVFADNLMDSWSKGNKKDPRPCLETILGQVERAAKITNHLRTFGRETQSNSFKLADINLIVEDSLLLVSELFRLNEIKLIKEFSGVLPRVNCQPVQIEQILANLLSNAKDAMENSLKKELTLRTYKREKSVVIEIEDTGAGIAENIQSKIFDPFFTTKEVGKGSGLGLSVSHGIIEEHGGKIEVESGNDPQKGTSRTIFRILLPGSS
ncbi:MAG: response regulator [SAR324 cluster bacterium]|nr:response regulator [SAR324 cluster bacterium]